MKAFRTSAAMSPGRAYLTFGLALGDGRGARRALVLHPGRHAIGFRARARRDLHRLAGRLDVGATLSRDATPPLGAAVGVGLGAFDLFGAQLAGSTFGARLDRAGDCAAAGSVVDRDCSRRSGRPTAATARRDPADRRGEHPDVADAAPHPGGTRPGVRREERSFDRRGARHDQDRRDDRSLRPAPLGRGRRSALPSRGSALSRRGGRSPEFFESRVLGSARPWGRDLGRPSEVDRSILRSAPSCGSRRSDPRASLSRGPRRTAPGPAVGRPAPGAARFALGGRPPEARRGGGFRDGTTQSY